VASMAIYYDPMNQIPTFAHVRFAFNQTYVDWIKAAVPSRNRNWNPVDKHWEVRDDPGVLGGLVSWVDTVEDWFRQEFPASPITRQTATSQNAPPQQGAPTPGNPQNQQTNFTSGSWSFNQQYTPGAGPAQGNRGGGPPRGRSSSQSSAWTKGPSQSGQRKTVPPAVSGSTSAAKSDYEILMLRDGAPFALVKTVYRWWAKELHPDVGGDPLRMTEINLAYGRLQKASK
jgi:hypothetical protein